MPRAYLNPVGTKGTIGLWDSTDDPQNLVVEVGIRTDPELDTGRSINWGYSLDGVDIQWSSFNVDLNTEWQGMASVYAGVSQTFTFYLADTGTTELDGPASFPIDLLGYLPPPGTSDYTVDVKDGVGYKKAVPYVKHDGIWKIATPYVRTPSGWVEIL